MFFEDFMSISGDYLELPVVIAQYIIVAFGVHFLVKNLKQVFNILNVGFIIIQHKCNEFVEDKALYKTCKANAKGSVKKFSIKNIAENWEELFV